MAKGKKRKNQRSSVSEGASPAASRSSASPSVIGGLIALSGLVAALAVFQWFELLASLRGESTVCSIGEKLDCAVVWGLPAAKTVHRVFGVPVAGLGLVWGLSALAQSVAARSRPWLYTGLRLTAVAGVASCLGFFALSAQAGTWCLTCLTTYALVFGFATLTVALPRPDGWWSHFLSSSAFAAGATLLAYLVVLIPGLRTPVETDYELPTVAGRSPQPAGAAEREGAVRAKATPPEPPSLRQFLEDLPPPALEALADGLRKYAKASRVDVSSFEIRNRWGSADAPVHIVDFIDVGCVHCKHLNGLLDQLKTRFSPSEFSMETRYYPLDGGCNPQLGTGGKAASFRCAGAKALICAEGREGHAGLRREVLERQNQLSPDALPELVQQVVGLEPRELKTCMEGEATQRKLMDDIAYAGRYDIKGTPLVVVNGRETPLSPPVLYALILSGGQLDHPALQSLGL